jgi:hypothetical protein
MTSDHAAGAPMRPAHSTICGPAATRGVRAAPPFSLWLAATALGLLGPVAAQSIDPSVTAALLAKEYEFSPVGTAGRSAPNRACNLRSVVTGSGVEVASRTPAHWRVGLCAMRLGRGSDMRELCAGTVVSKGQRAEILRDGLVEWYANDAAGLEQGFTLLNRPPGDSTLRLEIRISGTARAELSADGDVLTFADPEAGLVLRYSGLCVFGADRAPVTARMRLDGATLAIEADDRGAAYPLTIDPIMDRPAVIRDGNQANAQMGPVATAGDVNADGYSDVLIGVPLLDNGQVDEGFMWLYLGSPTGLAGSPSAYFETDQAGSKLGRSVAAAGDVNADGYDDWLVGAPEYTNGQLREGRAYLFLGRPTFGPPVSPAWIAEGDQVDAYFGFALGTAGDVNGDGFVDVIVGAYGYDNGQTDEGRAYVYLGSASGLSPQPARTVEANQTDAWLGFSVSTAGDTNADGYADVLVGAPSRVDQGMACLYLGSSAGLAQTPIWSALGSRAGANLGWAVANAGDVNGDGYADALVGEPHAARSIADEGAFYLYPGSASGLSGAVFVRGSGQTGSLYGSALATAGDVNGDGYADFMVGAAFYDGSLANEGLVEVFLGCPGYTTGVPYWSSRGGQSSGYYGTYLATAGDLNGDGFSDVLVGAYGYSRFLPNEGAMLLYHSAADGPGSTADWVGSLAQAGAAYGGQVAVAGDVDGDGFDDALVAAPWYDAGTFPDEGRVWLHRGSDVGLAAAASWTSGPGQVLSNYGAAMVGIGDANGDGYDDVAIAAPNFDDGASSNAGRVWVYSGGPAGLSTAAAWFAGGSRANASFGYAVAAGDVNGDAYADLLVGAPGDLRGTVWLYFGSPSWFAAPVQVPCPSAICLATGCGQTLACGGDYNGDGFDDFAVGAPQTMCGFNWVGIVGRYRGLATGFAADGATYGGGVPFIGTVLAMADVDGSGQAEVLLGTDRLLIGQDWHPWVLFSLPAPGNFLFRSLTPLGDANRDGRGDIAIGMTSNSSGAGRVEAHRFEAAAQGAVTPILMWSAADPGFTSFGASVAGNGDFNGDGFADLLVGAPGGNTAYCFYGNDARPGADAGLDRTAQQWRTDGAAPVAEGGRSDSASKIRIRAVGRTPAGRDRVRLEVELKPHGTPFDALLAYRGSRVDTGAPGNQGCRVAFDRVIDGLQASRAYHWRLRVAGASPFFPHSPWLGLPGTAESEVHFRTAGCAVAYTPIGTGLAGSGGFVPALAGAGGLCGPGQYGWQVTGGLGGAPGVLVLGVVPISLPFLGGTLYVAPDITVAVALGGVGPGNGTTTVTLPLELSAYAGATLYTQVLLLDPAAVYGLSFTNALRVSIR